MGLGNVRVNSEISKTFPLRRQSYCRISRSRQHPSHYKASEPPERALIALCKENDELKRALAERELDQRGILEGLYGGKLGDGGAKIKSTNRRATRRRDILTLGHRNGSNKKGGDLRNGEGR